MTIFMLAGALAALPLALLLRGPYFRLPLHIDTGFYVSNATILTGRTAFSRGWNALLAGCSKVLPEFFYSRVYLRHRGRGYTFWSRLYVTVYSWLTAVLLGAASFLATGGSETAFLGAVLVFTVFSAEPQYGVYFENAEQFEVLFQTAAILLLYLGFRTGNPVWIGAGIGLWMAESFFIKLSSLPGGAVLAAGSVFLMPSSLGPVAAGAAVAVLPYLVWVKINGRSLASLFRGVTSHEAYISRRKTLLNFAARRLMKLTFLGVQFLLGPAIPALAVAGACVSKDRLALLWLAATAVSHAAQSGLVWYYAIPLLPPIALLASQAPPPWPFLGVGLALVLLLIRTHAPRSLDRAVWGLYGMEMAERNRALDHWAESLREKVKGRTVLVYGQWNQAYVLLDTAYDTPLISPAEWLHPMAPGWERELHSKMVSNPPEFILDTEDRLDLVSLKANLGLTYSLESEHPPSLRLFRFRTSEGALNPGASTFRVPPPPDTRTLFGLRVANLDCEGLARKLLDRAGSRAPGGEVVALNVHTLTEGIRDRSYGDIFRESFLVFADGVPIVWASLLLNSPLVARTHGHELLEETLRQSEGTGIGHFFLGGTEGTLTTMRQRILSKYPQVQISGTYSPPFGALSAEDELAIVARINAANPGILWVALGAPRQERWIHRIKPLLRVPVLAGIGAAFEIVAGRFSRAPGFLQKMGLEWGWRLAQDPGRLWRRYFSTNGFFLGLMTRSLVARLLGKE